MHCHSNILRSVFVYVLILTICKEICYAEIIDDYNYEDDTYNDIRIVNKREWIQLKNENKKQNNEETIDQNIQNNESAANLWIDRDNTLRTYNKRAWEMMNLLWRKRQNGWNRRGGTGNWNSLKQLWGKRNDPQFNSLI